MDYYAPAGLIGAFAALAAGLAGYFAAIASIQNYFRSIAPSDTAEQRDDLEFKLGVMRRLILTVGFVAFAWGGYWLGKTVAG